MFQAIISSEEEEGHEGKIDKKVVSRFRLTNSRQFVFYNNRKVEGTKLSQTRDRNARETSKFIQSDATKFIILLALLLANRKNGRFLLVKK